MEQSREQTDNRDHEAMLARLRLSAIVELSDDAIIGKDINGIITDWNNGAASLFGYSADEMIGKSISILTPFDRADEFVEIMRKIRAGETIKHFDTVRLKKDGTRVQVSLTVLPVVDTNGRIILHENIELEKKRRALVTILDEDPKIEISETALLSERSLAEDWSTPKEDKVWQHLAELPSC